MTSRTSFFFPLRCSSAPLLFCPRNMASSFIFMFSHWFRESEQTRPRIQIARISFLNVFKTMPECWLCFYSSLSHLIFSRSHHHPLTTVPCGVFVLFLPALPVFWQQRKLASAMEINRVVRYSLALLKEDFSLSLLDTLKTFPAGPLPQHWLCAYW